MIEKFREISVMKNQLVTPLLMHKQQSVGAENPTVMRVPTEVHREQKTVSSQVAAEEKMDTFVRPRAKRNGKRKIIYYRIPDYSEVKPKVDNRWKTPPGRVERRSFV
jgi:hypothetical protein